MVFALTVPAPEHEAIITYDGISWPIRKEAEAYKLAKRLGTGGFWRLKAKPQT